MILLEKGNRILEETVSSVFTREKAQKIDVKLSDFDDVAYKVSVSQDDLNTLMVSMTCPVYNDFKDGASKAGSDGAFKEAFGDMVCEPEAGFDVSLKIKIDEVKDGGEELVQKIKIMKATVIGGGMDFFLSALAEGKSGGLEREKWNLRGDTGVYLCPGSDRVTIIFEIDFCEEVDKVIGKVFMQEFQNSVKNNRAAPPCKFSIDPPLELHSAPWNMKSNTGCLGYISFAVLPPHAKKNRQDVIHVLCTFRSFVQYHIKMSKSYWHSKMRTRTQTLLKVLNRAKVEDPNAGNTKKTAGGKTFRRG